MEDSGNTNPPALPGSAEEDAADAAPAAAADATDGEQPLESRDWYDHWQWRPTRAHPAPAIEVVAVKEQVEEEVVAEVPEQKFQVRQKVYTRDEKASGTMVSHKSE